MQFGDEFAGTLLELKPGHWAGPIRSGYGLHLVLVSEYIGGRLVDFSTVKEAGKQDWLVTRQQELKDAAYARIRERYVVTVEKPKLLTAVTGARETVQ